MVAKYLLLHSPCATLGLSNHRDLVGTFFGTCVLADRRNKNLMTQRNSAI